jgi:hypothetical protein
VDFGSAPNRGFGKDALNIDGRIFAMLVRSRFVLKLPRQRVDELVSRSTESPSIQDTVA